MKRTVSRVKGTMIFFMIFSALGHLHLTHMPRAVGRINIIREENSSLKGITKSLPVRKGPEIHLI